jgi:hypothetical protein
MLRLLLRKYVITVKLMFRLLKANSIPNFTIYLDKGRPAHYFRKNYFQALNLQAENNISCTIALSEIIPNIKAEHAVADVALVSFFIVVNAG